MILALTMAPAAHAQDRDAAIQLAPTTAWVVDYAEDSCALRRVFGNADGSVTIDLRQFSPGRPDFQLIALSKEFGTYTNRLARNVEVRYLPDAEAVPAQGAFNMYNSEGARGVTFTGNLLDGMVLPAGEGEQGLPQATINLSARERAVTGIELVRAFEDRVVLQTGLLERPMQAMRTCLEELVSHWGVDVVAHRTLRSRVVPVDQEDWAAELQQRYPSIMLRDGEQAVLRVRLGVNTEGRASSCNMQSRLGDEEFQETACNLLLRHARFLPAIDADGNAIASFYLLSIIYSTG